MQAIEGDWPLVPSALLFGYGIVVFLLVAKAQLLGAATAATRGKLKQFVNKEDADWLGGAHLDCDSDEVQRIFRAHRNDLEALLPFAIVGSL